MLPIPGRAFLAAACVAQPAPQFPAQTKLMQLELWYPAGGPEHQFNNKKTFRDMETTCSNNLLACFARDLKSHFCPLNPHLYFPYRLKITGT